MITDQTWPAPDTHPPVLEDQCRQGRPDRCHCCTDQSWQQLGCVRWAQKASRAAVLHYTAQQSSNQYIQQKYYICERDTLY